MLSSLKILTGDCRDAMKSLPDGSVHCVVTSPPYFGLRDYGVSGQIGLEDTPESFVSSLVSVFREVRRVLRDDGVVWLNLGDSYNANGRKGHGTRIGYKQGTNRASAGGHDRCRPSSPTAKAKDLLGIPWRVAFALQDDGWYLRSEVIWSKTNAMTESVCDRVSRSHEHIFMLAKSERYYFDFEVIREPATSVSEHKKRKRLVRSHGDSEESTKNMKGGHNVLGGMDGFRRKRSVWSIPTRPYRGAHFATFPPALIEPCILAGTSAGGCCEKCLAPLVRDDGVWVTQCKCESAVIPCTVLDPFGGSGTTAGVAIRHGRRAILCELNPEYVKLIPDRVNEIVTGVAPKKKITKSSSQKSLFSNDDLDSTV